MKTEVKMPQELPGNYQKLGEVPGTNPPLEPAGEPGLDPRPPAPRPVRQYISAVYATQSVIFCSAALAN